MPRASSSEGRSYRPPANSPRHRYRRGRPRQNLGVHLPPRHPKRSLPALWRQSKPRSSRCGIFRCPGRPARSLLRGCVSRSTGLMRSAISRLRMPRGYHPRGAWRARCGGARRSRRICGMNRLAVISSPTALAALIAVAGDRASRHRRSQRLYVKIAPAGTATPVSARTSRTAGALTGVTVRYPSPIRVAMHQHRVVVRSTIQNSQCRRGRKSPASRRGQAPGWCRPLQSATGCHPGPGWARG